VHLDRLCSMDLKYVGGFHMARPYGNEAGLGWGVGEGTVSGERLTGDAKWSTIRRGGATERCSRTLGA